MENVLIAGVVIGLLALVFAFIKSSFKIKQSEVNERMFEN